ncbi:MAG: IS1595 family transposase [Dehalococcoidales bacterium]
MEKYSTKDFEKDFPNDDACLEWLLKARYPQGVFCYKCGKVTNHYRIEKRPCYSCDICGNHIYPMAGTIFQDTKFNHLKLWFKAVDYMAVTRCGISSRQLSRDLGVTVKTGYRMWKQIRTVLTEGNAPIKFIGKVEVDETYIGGAKKGKRGRGSENKTVVMGFVEREGRARAIVIPDVKAKTLLPAVEANVIKDNTTVYTDDLPSYNKLESMGFNHETVAHSQKVYVTGKDIHTNSVEGFWSQLKRSINGTYHHVTPEHLQEYANEYSFRYSHRKDDKPMFTSMMNRVVEHASEKVLVK